MGLKLWVRKSIPFEVNKNKASAWDIEEDYDLSSKVLLHRRELPSS